MLPCCAALTDTDYLEPSRSSVDNPVTRLYNGKTITGAVIMAVQMKWHIVIPSTVYHLPMNAKRPIAMNASDMRIPDAR